MTRSLRKKAEGFTLLELLIVVAIIGVLAAIAIPNFMNASAKSKYGRALADTKVIVSQTQLFRNDTNAFPADLAALYANGTYMTSVFDPFEAAGTNYMATVNAAPVRAWTTGFDSTSAADWAGAAAITADDAGVSSQFGCSVGAGAASYARC